MISFCKNRIWRCLLLSIVVIAVILSISASLSAGDVDKAYWLVIGSYEQAQNANAMTDKLILLGELPEQVTISANGKSYIRIVIGPFEDIDSGIEYSKTLVSAGIEEPWVAFMSIPSVNNAELDIVSEETQPKSDDNLGSVEENNFVEPEESTNEDKQQIDLVENLQSEPEVRVGIFKTLNKSSKMSIGADYDLVVKGSKTFTDGSLPEVRTVSMQSKTFFMVPGQNANEICCESAEGGIVTFTGSIIVEPASGAVIPENKFIWVNSKVEVYRGRFEFLRNSNSGITVVNLIPVESYIRGVLVSEIGPGAPLEALCAQAVAIRTEVCFKSRHTSEGYDFCSSTHCQSYTGASSEYRVTILDQVIDKTRGVVMTYDGVPINEAKFYSCCGGVSESSQDIWGSKIPYLVNVNCEVDKGVFTGDLRDETALAEFISYKDPNHLCSSVDGYRWNKKYTADELQKQLAELAKSNKLTDPGALIGIEVITRSTRGAATEIKVMYENGSFNIKGENNIRTGLGGTSTIKSAVFVINVTEADGKKIYEFNGAGFGHGVGMCQNGAKQMARQGKNYEKILTTYYTGVSFSRIFR